MPQRQQNLLAASLEGPEKLRAGQLADRLFNSGSTWETWETARIPDSDAADVVRARGPNGRRLISCKDTGLAELMCAAWLRRRAAAGAGYPVSLLGALDGEQETAARMLLAEPVSCLSGPPGTGKTYVLRAVYDSFKAAGLAVALTAFTGAAASRLGESVGGEGTTIHRLLGFNGREGWKHNEHNRLAVEVCIIDEAGMLSIVLLWCLLRALPDNCIVIFVGDPYQLPSVEPGYVLGDLCEVFPHAQLSTVRRSNPNGPIGLAATAIMRGEIPRNAEAGADGFYQVAWDDDETICRKTAQIHRRISEIHEIAIPDVRIMAPTNAAVDRYNDYCKTRYRGPIPYMAVSNDAELGIYNGDIGYREGDLVRFTNGAEDSYAQSRHKVAFASTVYKMQGREAVGGMLVIPRRGAGVPKRSEVYTAVTRARNRFAVLGNLSYFAAAIRKPEPRRLTLLRELIQQSAEVL